jgi:hypothetical protein
MATLAMLKQSKKRVSGARDRLPVFDFRVIRLPPGGLVPPLAGNPSLAIASISEPAGDLERFCQL